MNLTLQQAEKFVELCDDAEWFGWEIGLITRTPQGTYRRFIAAEKGFYSVIGREYADLFKIVRNRSRQS